MYRQPFKHGEYFGVLGWKSSGLGVTAEIACYSLDQQGKPEKEVHRDAVKLHDDKQRIKFANTFFSKLPVKSEDERAKFVADREQELRKIENTCRNKDREASAPKQKANPPTQQPPSMTEDDRNQALSLLKDPALLERIKQDLTGMGIVGEDDNKVFVYLIASSRKMKDPLGATVKASSSSGKNNLIGKVASLMPEEDVRDFSYMSAKALLHVASDWAKHKLLMITEIVGKEQAEYLIRVFQSEGKVRSAVTVRDQEGGPFRVEEKEVEGPAAYLDTTTSYYTHPENATRIFEIYLDESHQQTDRIIQQQLREAGLEKFEIEAEREKIKKIHRTAQRLLKLGLDVIIPYNNLLNFPADDVRGRRDCPKLLSVIRVIAFLHQHQRTHKELPNGKEYIEAELVDYDLAYHLVKQRFADTLDDLDKRSRQVLEQVWKSVGEPDPDPNSLFSRAPFDRDDVAKICGRRKNKLTKVFEELEENEYFLDADGNSIQPRGNGTAKRTYTLNYAKLHNNKSVIDRLITPEDLRKAWESTQPEGDAHAPEPLSPLSPLSQP